MKNWSDYPIFLAVAEAGSLQEEASAIDRSSATLEDSLSGVVRLSATEGVGTSWLPGVMNRFRQEHPDVLVDIGIGFQSFNLAQREADIALRWRSPGECLLRLNILKNMARHPHRKS